jgi:uncharacterized protein (TIGR03000 family)
MLHRSFCKLGLSAIGLLGLFLGQAKAQTYDAINVYRLGEQTLYIFPRGYVPSAPYSPVAYPFAPVAYPWYPTAAVAAPGILPTMTPLSYTGESAAPSGLTSITLRVPENAEVWIQGKKTEEKGMERRFTLPSLDPGTIYDYDIRVAWTENGQKKSDTAHLNVRVGDQQSVNYIAAQAGSRDNRPEPRPEPAPAPAPVK